MTNDFSSRLRVLDASGDAYSAMQSYSSIGPFGRLGESLSLPLALDVPLLRFMSTTLKSMRRNDGSGVVIFFFLTIIVLVGVEIVVDMVAR